MAFKIKQCPSFKFNTSEVKYNRAIKENGSASVWGWSKTMERFKVIDSKLSINVVTVNIHFLETMCREKQEDQG